MSQEPEDEVEISIDGAIFTTEAELRAWYIATNPMLRSVGLSCPAKLYREMQFPGRVSRGTSLRKSSHLSLRFSDLIVIQRNPRDKGVSSEPL